MIMADASDHYAIEHELAVHIVRIAALYADARDGSDLVGEIDLGPRRIR